MTPDEGPKGLTVTSAEKEEAPTGETGLLRVPLWGTAMERKSITQVFIARLEAIALAFFAAGLSGARFQDVARDLPRFC